MVNWQYSFVLKVKFKLQKVSLRSTLIVADIFYEEYFDVISLYAKNECATRSRILYDT